MLNYIEIIPGENLHFLVGIKGAFNYSMVFLCRSTGVYDFQERHKADFEQASNVHKS